MKKPSILIQLFLFLGFVFWFAIVLTGQDKAQPDASSYSSKTAQPNYILGRYVIGSGGVISSTSTNFIHRATAGETCVADMQGANHIMLSGFWQTVVFEPTGVDQEDAEDLPTTFELHQNYPNPFNPQTTIRYELPNEYLVTVEIFNVFGQRIRLLVNAQIQGPGSNQVVWDGRNEQGKIIGSGIYLYRVTASPAMSQKNKYQVLFQDIKKMLLVK